MKKKSVRQVIDEYLKFNDIPTLLYWDIKDILADCKTDDEIKDRLTLLSRQITLQNYKTRGYDHSIPSGLGNEIVCDHIIKAVSELHQ